eukprot:20455-Heterococcus_DN1.PRE.5
MLQRFLPCKQLNIAASAPEDVHVAHQLQTGLSFKCQQCSASLEISYSATAAAAAAAAAVA